MVGFDEGELHATCAYSCDGHCAGRWHAAVCVSRGHGARYLRLGAQRGRRRAYRGARLLRGARRLCRRAVGPRACGSPRGVRCRCGFGTRHLGCRRRAGLSHRGVTGSDCAYDAHLARYRYLRRLPTRVVRPRRPTLSLPLYQLHQLWAALYHHPVAALRPSGHVHGLLSHVPRVCRGVCQPT